MTKKLSSSIRRKYYLNRKVKAFCKVSSRRRVVFILEAEKDALTGRNKAYFEELTIKYRYLTQFLMPI
ncbi:MAG: hypothetical protein Q7U54_07965 [Bacteroidales bacterium]|nr:hypothetical protein [Bacteroidales bacterium]